MLMLWLNKGHDENGVVVNQSISFSRMSRPNMPAVTADIPASSSWVPAEAMLRKWRS
jgi:hypothetical protein